MSLHEKSLSQNLMRPHAHTDKLSPWNAEEYCLLDFGQGRKLEQFGGFVVDRPCPAALDARRQHSAAWNAANLQVDQAGKVIAGQSPHGDWHCRFEQIVFRLRLTPFGHVGLFPEQAANWLWLQEAAKVLQSAKLSSISALNLFGYTGGTTLVLSAAGGQVVHVDASAPAVKWARENAEHSGLAERPIRWIVEDARRFVAREIRRGNRYDIIVLDPPSYGHGPNGKRWNIDEELQSLLLNCFELLSENAALLFTAHSNTLHESQISNWIAQCLPHHVVHCGRLSLVASDARQLDAGFFIRTIAKG